MGKPHTKCDSCLTFLECSNYKRVIKGIILRHRLHPGAIKAISLFVSIQTKSLIIRVLVILLFAINFAHHTNIPVQNLSKVAQGALGILMGDTGNQIKKINYNEEQTAAHLLLAPNLIVR